MLCEKVKLLLSEYFDEVLDAETAIQVSQHLDQCIPCRKELDELSAVHSRLRSLSGVRAPEYLRDLLRLRISDMRKNRWQVQLRDALERQWSIIRSTERICYMTRAIGTILTSALFFLIPFSIDPLSSEANSVIPERTVYTRAEKQQVALNVLANLGMLEEEYQKGPVSSRQSSIKSAIKPAINEQYLSNFGQRISQTGNDYEFSVVTHVDRSGQAKAQNVLEHPDAQGFLNSFNEVISTGRFAPARKNGETVPSHMILMFSKISVRPLS